MALHLSPAYRWKTVPQHWIYAGEAAYYLLQQELQAYEEFPFILDVTPLTRQTSIV